MSESLYLTFEIIGTIAFSVSGAIVGLYKRMDILGVCILGLTTAVGGGVIRDILVGVIPPNTFRNPIYATVAILTAIIVFIPQVRKTFLKNRRVYDLFMLWMDSIGLGIFTVIGIKVAMYAPIDSTMFLTVFVGVVTGVGGGVLRDVMAGEKPYIFVKHFYACASIIGAIITVLIWDYIGETLSMAVGTFIVVILRLLAAKYRWSLPKPCFEEMKQLKKNP